MRSAPPRTAPNRAAPNRAAPNRAAPNRAAPRRATSRRQWALVPAAVAVVLATAATAALAADPPSPSPVAATRPATRSADEVRRGMAMTATPQERNRRAYERAAMAVEPSPSGDFDQLPRYLAAYADEFISDRRAVAFGVTARRAEGSSGDAVVLDGPVEFEEHAAGLSDYLAALGFGNVEDRTTPLPTPAVGDEPFAVVRAGRTFLYDVPAASAGDRRRETVSECLAGETLLLLDRVGDEFLCHAADGYVGYVAAADVEPTDAATAEASLASGDVPAAVETAIASMREKMGLPYVWGGRSGEGVDCSGLMQTGFGSAGVLLPRDADQQSLGGRLVATRARRGGMRRGDLMFFLSSRGTVNHVAIYLGDDRVLESGGPGVHEWSADPASPDYDERRVRAFAFAKRVVE